MRFISSHNESGPPSLFLLDIQALEIDSAMIQLHSPFPLIAAGLV